jgi:uncharacterized paraquat-inducible protein A
VEERTIECLSCGATRELDAGTHPGDAGECPRCGYLGWADRESLTDTLRRMIHERLPVAGAAHLPP